MARQGWNQQDKLRALAIARATSAGNAAKETGVPRGTILRWMAASKNESGESSESRVIEKPKSAAVDSLTAKQRRFVQEYIIDMNATQAAIRAGYSARTAHVSGPRLLENVGVKQAIIEAIRPIAEETHIDALWVRARFKLISDRCVQGEPILDRDGNETGEWRFDAAGANRATEMLGKLVGAFPNEKIDLTHAGEVKQISEEHYRIVHEIASNPELREIIRRRFREGTDAVLSGHGET